MLAVNLLPPAPWLNGGHLEKRPRPVLITDLLVSQLKASLKLSVRLLQQEEDGTHVGRKARVEERERGSPP